LQGLDTDPGTQSWILCEPNSIMPCGKSAQAAQAKSRVSREKSFGKRIE
jgi:hypothetical protein